MSVHPSQSKWWNDVEDVELNYKVWSQIKENDPSITCLLVKEDNPFLQLITWESNGVHTTFSSNTNLKRITIYGSKTTVSNEQQKALKIFCKALIYNRSIEHLILKHWKAFVLTPHQEGHINFYDNEDLEICSICPVFYITGKSRSLRRLEILKCNMKRDNWNKFADFIEHGRIRNSLEQLILEENDLDNSMAGDIVSLLRVYQRLEKLSFVSLSRNDWVSCGADNLSTSLGKLLQSPNCNLQNLVLVNYNINNNDMKRISTGLTRGNKSLRVLKLFANTEWSMFFTDITSTGIFLTELDLSGNYINNKGIIALGHLLTSNKTIKSLNLYQVRGVTELGWNAFTKRIKDSSVEYLTLTNNSINDQGLISFGHMMKNNTTLRNLNLASIKIISDGWQPDGWQPLFSTLCSSKSTLKRLNLSNNSLNDAAVGTLARWLGTNTTLEHLNLHGCNGINPNGWIYFFRTLRNSNTVLKDLIVDNCIDIRDDVVPTLVSSLSSIRSLDSLGMGGGLWHITSEGHGWQTLATLLQNQNCMLTKLDIREKPNTFDDDALVAFADALRNNSTLCELNLSYNNNPAVSTWAALTDALCDKTSIETLYSSNHTLQKVVDEEDGQVNPDCHIDGHSYHFPKDLRSVLQINRCGTIAHAAREKIIRYHMLKGNDVNVKVFLEMEQNEMPSAISWLGRNDIGLSVLFKLSKSLPDLFESKMNMKVKVKRAKRKRVDFLTLLEDV